MGDREENIVRALDLISEQVTITKQATTVESKAVGHEAQDNFLNTVIEGETDLSLYTLLEYVKKIEKSIGRQERFRWGPREIDIDILFYDDVVSQDEDLEIPHPRLAERDFVLVPLAEIAPTLMHPKLGKTIAALAAELPDGRRAIMLK